MGEQAVSTNIVRVKVNELINLLLPIYLHSAKKNDYSKIPANMMWGPPGVGKSESIWTLKAILEENTGKRVVVTDVRLLLFNPVDLRGIPVPDKKRENAVWLKPHIFQLDPSDNVINIVLLDEISAAPPSVQAAAYQLVLNRQVGEHKLPNNTIMIAAGNRLVDKGVSYKMPTPLANRMAHFEIYPEVEDWKEWAIPNGMDARIIGFLNSRPTHLFKFDPASDDVAFCTPRSWSFVNQYLDIYGKVEPARTMIAGSIGLGATTEFAAYCRVADSIPDVKAIMNGTHTQVPTGPDVLYALSAAITTYSATADDNQLKNMAKYTMSMPKEFSVLTMKDTLRVQTQKGTVKSRLLTMPEWVKWARDHRLFIA